jgi:hypothetical protein
MSRLCKIKLSCKDYKTKEYGEYVFQGEVVLLDSDLKKYLYRFFDEEGEPLSVSIDFSKNVVSIIEERKDIVIHLLLEKDQMNKCLYQLGQSNYLEFKTLTWDWMFDENRVYLDYDLYAMEDQKNDHPISRNQVEIIVGK